ncbi:ATP-binding protein [Streptosporangium canum]|uniref:ATP-binding protein n=1 Tax=Streptosporangium canum TaxID=324952 RepID=UPI00369A1567
MMNDHAGSRSVHLGQFRLTRLQVVNWGTFCGYKDLRIDERGVLFTGPSGSGKSSLLDAHSMALLPTHDQRFNASADLSAKGAKQSTRHAADYVRGAWSENDDEHGHSQVRYLRGGKPTWSAIGVTYDNGRGAVTTGVVVKWFPGTGNDRASLNTLHLLHEGHFELTVLDRWAHQQRHPFDTKWLKAAYPAPATLYPPSEEYTRSLARRVGLGASKTAISLLGKAKAMKNVGDLNLFIRDNMLEEPQTFAAANTMIDLFTPLDEAYQTTRRAHAQEEALRPVSAHWPIYCQAKQKSNLAASLQGEPMEHYLRGVHLHLLTEEITRLETGIAQLTERLAEQRLQEAEAEAAYTSLNDQLRREGKPLTDLQEDLRRTTAQLDDRKNTYRIFGGHVTCLGLAVPEDQEGFAAVQERLPALLQSLRALQEELRPQRREAAQAAGEAIGRHRDRCAELAALHRTGSLIPLPSIDRRRSIARGAQVPVDELAYAAELIDIAEGQERWRPTAEKVLRTFGLRLLVPARHTEAVSRFIDEHDMRGIVDYSIVTAVSTHQPQPEPHTLAAKLTVDTGHRSGAWLAGQLTRQFAHVCVETAQDLERHPIAVTVHGTVKARGNHYRKDDRPELISPSSYILGANTAAKIAALAAEVADLTTAKDHAEAEADRLDHNWQGIETSIAAATQLTAYTSWTKLDHQASARAAEALRERITGITTHNVNLRLLQKQRTAAETTWKQLIGACSQTTTALTQAHERQARLKDDYGRQLLKPHQVDDAARTYLDQVYSGLGTPGSVDRMDELHRDFGKELERRKHDADTDQRLSATTIKTAIELFLRQWPDAAPDDSGDVDRCGADFAALHEQIANRRLPEAMSRFQTMISEDMVPSISVLYRTIETSITDIRRRVDMVNAGLRRVEFNPATHLQIAYTAKQFDAAKQFRRIVDDLHRNAAATRRGRTDPLGQFRRVRELMTRFTAKDPESRRWRETVLDVRLSCTFYGREEQADHGTVHTYRNTAAGSGGEQEKLVAFCLAAALSYNLADDECGGRPRFAPLMLDEAFSKSDETYAAQALAAFEEFGFQLLIAAPIRMSGVVEPFIGQAVLVEKRATADGVRSNAASATFGDLAVRHAADTDGGLHAPA